MRGDIKYLVIEGVLVNSSGDAKGGNIRAIQWKLLVVAVWNGESGG